MTLVAKLWRAFARLFGLDTCPLPPATQPRTQQQADVRERLTRRLERGGSSERWKGVSTEAPYSGRNTLTQVNVSEPKMK